MTNSPMGAMPIFPDGEVLRARYESEWDTLVLSSERREPALAVDVEGELWLEYVPAQDRVVGFRIEGYASHFLRDRPEVSAAWQRGDTESVIDAVLQYAKEACRRPGIELAVG